MSLHSFFLEVLYLNELLGDVVVGLLFQLIDFFLALCFQPFQTLLVPAFHCKAVVQKSTGSYETPSKFPAKVGQGGKWLPIVKKSWAIDK